MSATQLHLDGGEHRRWAKPLDGFDHLAYQRGVEPMWCRRCQRCGDSIEHRSAQFAYEWAIGHTQAHAWLDEPKFRR